MRARLINAATYRTAGQLRVVWQREPTGGVRQGPSGRKPGVSAWRGRLLAPQLVGGDYLSEKL